SAVSVNGVSALQALALARYARRDCRRTSWFTGKHDDADVSSALVGPLLPRGFARLVLRSAPAVAADAEEMIGTGSLEDHRDRAVMSRRSGKGPDMRTLRAALLAVLTLSLPIAAEAQSPGDVFRKVTPSVVVIRAKGSEVTAAGQVRFTETGSGVLISSDGKVMTAAHVVHSMNEISVEFLGGETVSAKVVASEPAADLSLIQ